MDASPSDGPTFVLFVTSFRAGPGTNIGTTRKRCRVICANLAGKDMGLARCAMRKQSSGLGRYRPTSPVRVVEVTQRCPSQRASSAWLFSRSKTARSSRIWRDPSLSLQGWHRHLQRFLVVPMIVPGPARNDVTKGTEVGASEFDLVKTTSLWQPSLTASHHHRELEIPARPQRGASHEELRFVNCRSCLVQGGASLLPSTENKLLTPPAL